MKPFRFLRHLAASAALLLGVAVLHAQQAGEAIPDEYIVQLKPGATPEAVAGRHGLAMRFAYDRVLNGFAGHIPPGLLKRLQNDPQVAAIVPDRVVEILGKPGGGGGGTTTQVVPEGVKRIGAAPGSGLPTGAGVGVAVVDTGLDFGHADLLPLGVGYYSAYGSAADQHGHGTHVGGIIAARNNLRDVVGVAPAATLYAVRVLDASGSGSDSAVIGGLDWVYENWDLVSPPIRVVNMSLGRRASQNPAEDALMRQAVQRLVDAGVTVVVAAGNERSVEVAAMVPAGFPEVIAVASSTAKQGTTSKTIGYYPKDAASWFTTDGAMQSTGTGVAISAPGEDQTNVSGAGALTSIGILSTKLGGGTTRMYGTSMASPHVAGVVALLYAANSALSPADAKLKVMGGGQLIDTAPLDSRTSKNYGVDGYTFDGDREGILSASGALTFIPTP